MVAFWLTVWLLIAVQMGIGLLITQLYYDPPPNSNRAVEEVASDG